VVHFDEIPVLFFYEEPTVTDNTFMAMLENSALHQVLLGTIFQ
jgi:hypothetical protein